MRTCDMLKQPDTIEELEVTNLLQCAYQLDEELIQWEADYPSDWKGESIALTGQLATNSLYTLSQLSDDDVRKLPCWPAVPFLSKYSSITQAQAFNQYRSARIYIYTVVIRWLAWLGHRNAESQYAVEYQRSCQVVQNLIDEICATVPFVMGYDVDNLALKSVADLLQGDCDRPCLAAAQEVLVILHPLFLSVRMETLKEQQRTWCRGRLYALGEVGGWRQAKVFSQANPSLITLGETFEGRPVYKYLQEWHSWVYGDSEKLFNPMQTGAFELPS